MTVTTLGEPRFATPIPRPVDEHARIPAEIVRTEDGAPSAGLLFEVAGPRERLFFDPARTRAGIVTCGGLCPGLNDVIRSLYLELHHAYGVRELLGFRNGYQGLDPDAADQPVPLDHEFVDGIHRRGGTVLGTSRGPVDIRRAVDNLIRLGIDVLFTIGGDGTQRGARALFREAQSRGHALAVVGVPKTIDNDVAFVTRSFGYLTAVEQAAAVLERAHTEARSVPNGIALVKVMGRHAGFIAVGATVANQDVNFTLIPEVPFELEGERGLLPALERRIRERQHALVVVAEGAGQDLLASRELGRDASGNVVLKDIGAFLRSRIEAHFAAGSIPAVMRYFDPGYFIRSSPANAADAILCDLFARHAVHAAMAGKTGVVIGYIHDRFVHVPIELLSGHEKRVDVESFAWRATLATTRQWALFA
jgi:6-phosphofructokinase 1